MTKRVVSLFLSLAMMLSFVPAYRIVADATGETSNYAQLNNAAADIPEDAFFWNSHYYAVFANCKSWREAEQYCQSLGGHLATITSAEENAAVFGYVTSLGYKSVYFGLTDAEKEGTWKWVTGEKVDYLNWHSGEPNCESSREDYAMFYYKYSDGKWNDGDFGGTTVNGGKAFICEWNLGNDTTPEEKICTINALNALLIGVEYYPSLQSTDVSQWSNEIICDVIWNKLLWDDYHFSDSSYLSKIGLEYRTDNDGYLHFDLDIIQRITSDTLGTDFPSETKSDCIFVSGEELLIVQAIGESRSLLIQDFIKSGSRVIAVGIAVHHNNADSDFLGYFEAVFEENTSSVYGYTLHSLSSLESNQNFEKLTASASSELKEETTTHYAGNVLDKDLGTAWAEGVNGVGRNEWIKLETTDRSNMDVSAIQFSMGYHKNNQALQNNGWPYKVHIETEGGYSQTAEFYDYTDIVVLDQAVTTSWIKITILEASTGKKYDDTCISEISLLGIDTSVFFQGYEDSFSESDLQEFASALEGQYGVCSNTMFISCIGTMVQPYPESIYGILSVNRLDWDMDNVDEVVVMRITNENNNGISQLIADVYHYESGKFILLDSEYIYNIDYSGAAYGYFYYSESLDRLCLLVESKTSGSYTGVDSREAKVFVWEENIIKEYADWSFVPGIVMDDLERELLAIGAPFARYCSDFDNRTEDTYFLTMFEIGHGFKDSFHYLCIMAHSTPVACALRDLEPVDFLALSSLAYENFSKEDLGSTIRDYLSEKWSDKWSGTEITYNLLYERVAEWRIRNYSENKGTGFYAVAFQNDQNEIVLAYRGSAPIPNNLLTIDAVNDWLLNDVPMIAFNSIVANNQYEDAFATYEYTIEQYSPREIVTTGHSLGGGLGDIVSARYGCKAETFNAISMLDVVYFHLPKLLGENFKGVDLWKIRDHANQYDRAAGVFEKTFSTQMKPFIAYKSLYSDVLIDGTINALLFRHHGLSSYVEKKTDGTVGLTDEVYRYTPTTTLLNHLSSILPWGKAAVDLGTSNNDTLALGLIYSISRSSYGGIGDDYIVTSEWDDSLIGGKGDDSLNGGWGNDQYIYYKGDGIDTIHDPAGNDKLYLYGFSESDIIEAVAASDDSEYIEIHCNGELIVRIYKENRSFNWIAVDKFTVYKEIGNYICDEYNITSLFKKKVYGKRLRIACPVNVEILDIQGNVVYTLEDGVPGSYYTEYGNFYVFEEENGEYGKVLDLVEGYSARVVGVAEGTMEASCWEVVDGVLSEEKKVSDIPVTENYVARIDTGETGEIQLTAEAEESHTHTWNSGVVTVAPTCEKTGTVLYICTEDPSHTMYVSAPVVDHSYENGKCQFCGLDEPAGIPGDVTGDGKADYSDALLILRASIGLDTLTEDQKQIADVNADGKADYSDALLILRRSIGLE